MKRLWCVGLTFLMALALLAGCATISRKTSVAKSSPGKTKKGLYSQVPAAMRAPVREAEFDLAQAKAKVGNAREKLKLAEMQEERALLESKYADYGMKLAEILERAAELEVEIKKLEAIDNANLGDKEDNIRQIANVKTKKLRMESDAILVNAEFDTAELRIKKLTKKIEAQRNIANKEENIKAQITKPTKTQNKKKVKTQKRRVK